MQKPKVIIEYCPACKWLLRSAWLAQELLTTFEADLGEVTLRPSAESGIFVITVDGLEVWERKKDQGFPEAKILKRRIRDIILPDRSLGHSDK